MGAAEIQALLAVINGPLGYAASLVLTLTGLYQILVARNTGLGLIMLAVGLILPFTFNLLSGIEGGFCKTIRILGGTCATWNAGQH